MNDIQVGDLVVLIGCDNFMPPLGAEGEVVGPLDCYGDHEVLFPKYPCPVETITWEIPKVWLMKIYPLSELEDTNIKETMEV